MLSFGLHETLRFLLRLCHQVVLAYAWMMVARAVLDAVILFSPPLKNRLLLLENVLLAITDPVLEPIRRLFRTWLPPWLDLSAFLGVVICLLLDFLIVNVSARL